MKPGSTIGFLDKQPMGAFMNKGLTLKAGQRYMRPLLEKLQSRAIDPSSVITHHVPLDQAPDAYTKFRYKKDGCIKFVLKP